MAIVTISRGAFSGGPEVAEKVAATLGYRCISREVLSEASKRYGIPEAKFTEVLETKPHWWERWLESLRLYRIVLQAAMCEVVQEGNVVYHGHAGQELLSGVRHVLRVQLTAPMEYRIEQVRERQKTSEDAARVYIDQVDKARTRRLQAVFGADWRDPSRYDLVLNVARLSLESVSRLIVEAVQRPEFQPTAESEQAFQDLALSARVQAALITSPKTRNLNVNVRAEKGEVRISGILTYPEFEQEITQIAESVPGVKRIVTAFESPPIEYMYP
jgi:cytidylate kinase